MTALMRTAAVLLLLALLGGCHEDKRLTWDYGKAYHSVFENQKLDPKAGDGSPVVGLDGSKAVQAYDRYQKAGPEEKKEKGGFKMDFKPQ